EKENKQINSKALFLSSAIFFGCMFWTMLSSSYGGDSAGLHSKNLSMGAYGILGLCTAALGNHFYRKGVKTIEGPSPRALAWGILAVALVGVIGAVTIYFTNASTPILP
ncbi:MAG: drug/metabolite transporter (DMT)-like permease, partial [Kiritimatiellia bacterium]